MTSSTALPRPLTPTPIRPQRGTPPQRGWHPRSAFQAWRVWMPWAAIAIMTLAFATVFIWLSLARHAAYQSHAFDLGNMDQAVWNTLQGKFLRFTDMDVGHHVLTSRLAIHVEPLLAVFAVLYLIHPGPETLLCAQAVVVSLGTVPAYLLARVVTGRIWLSLVFPLAYLLHPSLQNAVLDDFHAVTLSACFLLWALYFAWRSNVPAFAAFAILAASTKEEVALLVSMIGLLLLYRRRIVVGAITAFSGLVWFLICVRVIIPAYNPAGQSPYLARYSYLGHGLGGVVSGIVHHPDLVIRTLTSAPRVVYLVAILHPLGFTPLLGLPVLLLALPALLINMLSSNPTTYSGFYQYSAEVIPFTIAGAAVGVSTVSRWLRRFPATRPEWSLPLLCSVVLVASAYDSWQYGFSPLARGDNVPVAGNHQALEQRIIGQIPADAVVAAADEIEPHLSDRSWIYLLPTVHPNNGPAARYIVLDASIPAEPVEPHTLHQVAVGALRRGYGVVAAHDGILLLRQGAASRRIPRSFYSFMFEAGDAVIPEHLRWGPLELVGVTIHPRDGPVNRARPAIGISTYWRLARPVLRRATIAFYLSPVYSGVHLKASGVWTPYRDTPTLDWLPLDHWPVGRTIRVDSLPLLPEPDSSGSVDVAAGVFGLGPVSSTSATTQIAGSSRLSRLGTVTVQP